MTIAIYLAAITAVIGFAITGPAAAQVMVLNAEGPSAAAYPAGTMLPSNKPLTLKNGDHVTIMIGGGTRRLDGPGSPIPSQLSVTSPNPLWEVLFGQKPHAGHLIPGASRGASRQDGSRAILDAPTNIWQMAISSPGNLCFARGQPVALWRPGIDVAGVDITRVADNSKRTITWPAGNQSLDWPAGLPLADNERYLVSLSDGVEIPLVWRAVDPPAGDWPAFARQLAAKGCNAQLATLRASIAVAP